jgi:hypothetical protein
MASPVGSTLDNGSNEHAVVPLGEETSRDESLQDSAARVAVQLLQSATLCQRHGEPRDFQELASDQCHPPGELG